MKAARASANCGARQLSSMSDDSPKPGASHATTVWSRERSGSIHCQMRLSLGAPCSMTSGGPDARTGVGDPHPVDVDVLHTSILPQNRRPPRRGLQYAALAGRDVVDRYDFIIELAMTWLPDLQLATHGGDIEEAFMYQPCTSTAVNNGIPRGLTDTRKILITRRSQVQILPPPPKALVRHHV